METMFNAAYWRRVCPHLTVSEPSKKRKREPPLKLKKAILRQMKQAIDDEGYFQLPAKRLEGPVSSHALAQGVVRLMQHGWEPSFIVVYDEAWWLIEHLSEVMSSTTGGNRCNCDIVTWYVDPAKDEAGFAPHRDRQPDDAPASFRADGSPRYSTCWYALTDAYPDNGCLYMLPRHADPGYYKGDDDESELDPLQVAMQGRVTKRGQENQGGYQAIRALPCERGSANFFTHRIIHWGSKGRKATQLGPRIAFSFACSDPTFEKPYFPSENLPLPQLQLRVSLAAGQMLNYYQRFGLNESQLCFFRDIFEATNLTPRHSTPQRLIPYPRPMPHGSTPPTPQRSRPSSPRHASNYTREPTASAGRCPKALSGP